MRKLVQLLATGLIFYVAMAAPASALEVTEEASGVHCDTTVTENDAPVTPEVEGGCPVRLYGEAIEIGGAFGAMMACDLALEGRISESGHFIASSYDWPICQIGGMQPCTGVGNRHPDVQISGTGSPWSVELEICLHISTTPIPCHFAATMTSSAHDYAIELMHAAKCENLEILSLDGVLTTDPDAEHPDVEVG